MIVLNENIGVCVDTVPTTMSVSIKFDELEERLQKEIQDKFERCYRAIDKAKWKQHFGTRRCSKTYGRWDK